MPQFIEIDGGLVSIVERTVIRSVALDEWLPRIERRVPIYMPSLPSGTRAAWWDPTTIDEQRLMLLMEREPTIASLRISGRVFRLSIPWMRFSFYASTRNPGNDASWQLGDYRVYFAKHRYTGPNVEDMLPAMLPNVYSDGRICFGSTAPDSSQSIADRLDQIANEFLSSTFNHDLDIRRPAHFPSYREWSRETRHDPLGWLKWAEFNSAAHNSRMTSWTHLTESLMNGDNRNEPVFTSSSIPPLQTGATFGRVTEWIDELEPTHRARLLIAAQAYAARAPEAVTMPLDDEDEQDDEDEEDEE